MSTPIRILICGSRFWSNRESIRREILRLKPSVVIEGEASGADTIAREEAESLGISVLKFPANWKRYGRAAGPIRNKQMLVEGKPDTILAFHEDISKSRGTANMVQQAKKAGLPVQIFTS